MVLKGLFNYASFVYCFKLIILLLYIHTHYTCNIVKELCFIYPCFLYCNKPSVGYTVYGSSKNVCVVSVNPVCI